MENQSLRSWGAKILSQTVRRKTLKKQFGDDSQLAQKLGPQKSLAQINKRGRGICCITAAKVTPAGTERGKGKTSSTVRIPRRGNTVPNLYGTANDVPLELQWCIKIYVLAQN